MVNVKHLCGQKLFSKSFDQDESVGVVSPRGGPVSFVRGALTITEVARYHLPSAREAVRSTLKPFANHLREQLAL